MLKHFVIVFSTLLICSCSSTTSNLIHQAPSEPNQLKISQKGELKVSGSFKFNKKNGDRDKYRNFQIGYSPKNNLGLFFGHSSLRNFKKNSFFSMNNLSIGAYKFYKSKAKSRIPNFYGNDKGLLLELYAGVGLGKMKNFTFFSPSMAKHKLDISKLKMVKYYIRSGVHWQGELIGLSLGLNSGILNYYKGEIILHKESNQILLQHFKKVLEDKRGYFVAPSAKLSLGSKDLNLYVGSTFQKIYSLSAFEAKSSIFYLGLDINIFEARHLFERRKKRKLKELLDQFN